MQMRCVVVSCAALIGVAGATFLGGCRTACKTCNAGATAGRAKVAGAASPATVAMMDRIKGLAGEWESENPEKPGEWRVASVFAVSSGGNIVREIMMPGSSYEMTNTYHLDGDSIVVTHYCAIGNQPRMRAVANDGHNHPANQMHFQFDSVTNFAGGDQTYMGDLTLNFEGSDNLTTVWRSYQHGKMAEDSHATFHLRRRK
jgi:hypothetical protein